MDTKCSLMNLQVYYSEQIIKAPVTAVEGKCDVKNKRDFQFTDCHNSLYVFEHAFFCQHLYDTENGTLKQVITYFSICLAHILYGNCFICIPKLHHVHPHASMTKLLMCIISCTVTVTP